MVSRLFFVFWIFLLYLAGPLQAGQALPYHTKSSPYFKKSHAYWHRTNENAVKKLIRQIDQGLEALFKELREILQS